MNFKVEDILCVQAISYTSDYKWYHYREAGRLRFLKNILKETYVGMVHSGFYEMLGFSVNTGPLFFDRKNITKCSLYKL